MPTNVSTINEFCARFKCSRSFLYKMIAAGRGPEILPMGGKRMITDEAGEAWLRKLAAEARQRTAPAAADAQKPKRRAGARR